MTNQLIMRAQILLQQQKYNEAARLLGDILGKDPTNIHVLAMLSEVKFQLDQYQEAETLINNAIGLSPDEDSLYFIKAKVMNQLDRNNDAEQLLRTAIEINPYEAAYFALWGGIKMERKQYEEALDLANHALELDSAHVMALNVRSRALLKLDRKEDSFQTIEGALAEDPNNPYTHSNYGWGLLEKGDPKKALHHFREALRADPNFDYAQAGMMEALKARYWLYRVFLKYVFWMSNLTTKYQWGVILGLYFGTRFLNVLADRYEALSPYLMPLVTLLVLFAFSTWVIGPISNLFLRLNPFGKHLLSREERLSSNFVGVSLLLFLLGLVAFLFIGTEPWLALTMYGFMMMVPLSAMFTKAKYNALIIYAAGMAVVGALGVLTAFVTESVESIFATVFLVGFIAFQWIVNFVRTKK